MSDGKKHIVIAPQAAQMALVPADWQRQIGEIAGMDIVGSGFGRLQVRADEAGLQAAREKFGSVLRFEVAEPRTAAGEG